VSTLGISSTGGLWPANINIITPKVWILKSASPLSQMAVLLKTPLTILMEFLVNYGDYN
jgi:hypothetical protein